MLAVALHNPKMREEALRITIPPLVATTLFIASLFWLLLPLFESKLLEQKRNELRLLNNFAVQTLETFAAQAKRGEIDQDTAKNKAIEHLRRLRHGKDNKDYFWLNDLQATMIMHPYRPELEGRNLTEFTDIEGKRIFEEFVRLAVSEGEGFTSYVWQWHDHPDIMADKLSHITLFRPWNWIIGTGIYLDELHRDMKELQRGATSSSILIFTATFLLAAYSIRHGLRRLREILESNEEVERQRSQLSVLLEERSAALNNAARQVKTLEGLLPICATCKKIRDEQGDWQQVEVYVRDRSAVDFSHSICPECLAEYRKKYL